uniref:NudC N-terminal domain-containing protein n=1 Tax=Cyprinodon variegatus TaxID=28743 RepID=A0A3Q2FHL3_CYPVA
MASRLEMTEMYDNALLGILQHVGNIQDFLQVYFGFLYRKTDFYRLLSGPNDRMGFPPGVAEKMVLKTFRMFEKLAEQDRERAQSGRRNEAPRVPPAAQELEVTSEPGEAAAEQSGTEPPQMESAPSDGGEVPAAAASDNRFLRRSAEIQRPFLNMCTCEFSCTRETLSASGLVLFQFTRTRRQRTDKVPGCCSLLSLFTQHASEQQLPMERSQSSEY